MPVIIWGEKTGLRRFEDRLNEAELQRLYEWATDDELLEFLVRNAGEVVPSDILLGRVFGYSPEARTRTLHVHVRRLREKLGIYRGQYIETIFGVGYRFKPFRPAKTPEELAGYRVGFQIN